MNNTDNSTWKPFQDEINPPNYAVLGGFNVFPINMAGHEDDLLLNLDSSNCKKFQQALGNVKAPLKSIKDEHEFFID